MTKQANSCSKIPYDDGNDNHTMIIRISPDATKPSLFAVPTVGNEKDRCLNSDHSSAFQPVTANQCLTAALRLLWQLCPGIRLCELEHNVLPPHTLLHFHLPHAVKVVMLI